MSPNTGPILFLNGFWHGSWCWNEVCAAVAVGGSSAVAVDMAGHGLRARRPQCLTSRRFDREALTTEVSPVSDVDLDQAGALLAEQIKSVGRAGPVTVAAHSMGGTVLTRAVQLVPEYVAHAVYLAAFMPDSDRSAAEYVPTKENAGESVTPLLVADPATVGALRIDVTSDDVDYRKQLRTTFYGGVDPTIADAASALLSPDGPALIATGSTTLTNAGWGSVPRTYVVCTQDMAIRPGLQRKFIRDADARFPTNLTAVVTLETAHSPFLTMPKQVADIVASAAQAIDGESATTLRGQST